jgi:hypothetical protein
LGRIGSLTPAGCAVLERLVGARRAHLADLVAEWSLHQGEDAATYLRRVVYGLVEDVRRPA